MAHAPAAALWDATLTGFPADASIVSVRAWPGIVTVGVTYGPDAAARAEVIFASATGRQIRWYQAAPFGGAVAASPQTTVIVGATAVTAYANRTGAVRWSRPTGAAAQAWQVNGPDLYVTEAGGGYLGSAPVTALRRIDLDDGLESIIRPAASAFPGSLSGVAGDVVLFSAATGVTAFDGADRAAALVAGRRGPRGHRPGPGPLLSHRGHHPGRRQPADRPCPRPRLRFGGGGPGRHVRGAGRRGPGS